MNTYHKFCPNVFVSKGTEAYERGATILVTTKYGKENECIVFNRIGFKDGFYYHSIVRADGFNVQEFAKQKAERYNQWATAREKKADEYYKASQEGKDFLVLAEPIKVGHHSEKRHRALIERNWNRMGKCVENSDKAKEHESKAEYWEKRANIINLSMPESLEYFEYKLEKAKEFHKNLKEGKIKKEHSFSLTYAKKEVNDLEDKVKLAIKLWA